MTDDKFTCPLCGFRFNPLEHPACTSCPLVKGCSMVCCPVCHHTTIDTKRSRLARLAVNLFSKGEKSGTIPLQ